MKKNSSLLIFSLVLIISGWLTGCDAHSDYYARPEWLEPPIYQQLKDSGIFTHYLQCVDIAKFDKTLKGAGYNTVFAPTDEAFNQYLKLKGVNSVADLDSVLVKKIVAYSIVSNAYDKERLDDYQSTTELDWIPDIAFKRKTQYFKWVYDENYNGSVNKVFDNPAVASEAGFSVTYPSDDNNYKHIPYFTSKFMNSKGLTAYDYNYFYPNTTFTGFNVVDANVVGGNLRAENGYIHIVDKVIEPLPNINEIIDGNSEYSLFKELLDKYMKTYVAAPVSFLDRYRLITGSNQDVLYKCYPTLNFSPNCENYMRYGGGETYDAQIDGWTMFVPNNRAVQQFYNEKFLKNYGSLDNMPQSIIAEFVNAHMFKNSVWPSKFDKIFNPFGEPARFNPETDVVERKIASNGLFYGTNQIQKTNSFYTLMGELYLNPKYSLMLQALIATEVYYEVRNPKSNITLLMIPNEAFIAAGFNFNLATNSWTLSNTRMGINASVALKRFIEFHVISNYDNIVPANFMGRSVLKTLGGEYINYYNRLVWGLGNARLSEFPVSSARDESPTNGESYILSKAIQFADDEIGVDIMSNSNYSVYATYLKWASKTLPGYIYDESTFKIRDVDRTKYNTILIPNNTAMNAAIKDGVLPKIGFNPFTDVELDQVLRFVMYHIIPKKMVIPGKEGTGVSATLHKTVDGTVFVNVLNNSETDVMFEDVKGNKVSIVPAQSTVLANRAVIHLLNGYLKYQ